MAYDVQKDYYYTKDDTWVTKTPTGTILFGISDYAQRNLQRIEYLSLPEKGDSVHSGESLGEIESGKALSELIAPITGTVLAINEAVIDNPEIVNLSPYGDGWILKLICDNYEEQVHSLMDADTYNTYHN